MNTETGRLYPADEYAERSARAERRERERARAKVDEHQAEFEAALAEGKIVPVSDAVAQQVRLGQRELERRSRRRKAAKAARKRNRQ